MIIISIIIIIYFLAFPVYNWNKIKYVVDQGILWKLEVAFGQQKSALACTKHITERRGRVVNTFDSYSGDLGFNIGPYTGYPD
jgi:hypothetical protein